mmetsp:Transcript_5442/g.6638  ORF Transcript_5442/g.6638 Transcript_5442/m.6638 type:complete len:239 (-) Transcript_5442:20-736(-)
MRLAWHASGTYDAKSKTGGSNGATMRFKPESTDGANAGLDIMRDIVAPIKEKFPDVSLADIWTYAGKMSIEESGGPKIQFSFGRGDDETGKNCPENGRLPDAAKGAQHLRDVFYRMGFDDRAIVALSGGHNLGSCHTDRSGFSGPWTTNPLKFDNEYYINLVEKEWIEKKWDGPFQYTDKATGKLMMLPTDIALMKDEKFKVIVEEYAKDKDSFFKDFAKYFSQLLHLGCEEAMKAKK